MGENLYPVSRIDQCKLWKECWEDAQELGVEYVYIIAKCQALFSYRVGVLNDRILDHDMFEDDDEKIGLTLEDIDP